MRLARHAFPLAVAAIAAVFLGLFFLLPLIKVFGASILDASGTRFTLGELHHRAVEPLLPQRPDQQPHASRRRPRCSPCSIGVPFAFCLARLPIGGKAALLALAALPLVLPSFVGAYALVLLFGRSGIVTGALQSLGIPFDSIYGAKGIVAVYTLTLYPYVVLPVTAAFKSIDISVEEAAQNLGASRARVLRTVTLPLVLPSILAGGLLVFIEALENFGVPFVLAEDRPILSVEAYKLFVGETTDNPASAGVLGVLLVVCTIVALMIQRGVLARRHYATGARRAAPLIRGQPRVAPPRRRLLLDRGRRRAGAVRRRGGDLVHEVQRAGAACRLLDRQFRAAVRALLPAAHQHAAARRPCGLRRDLDRRSGRLRHRAPPLAALRADRHRGDVALRGRRNRARHRPRDDLFVSGALILTGTWIIMVLAYMVRKLPFSVRSAGAILHQIDPSLEEASINLGVPPALTFLRITVPLMLGGIVGGFVLTFVTVASELSATVVLYSGPWTTMTVAMFQALEGTSAGIADGGGGICCG